MEGPNNTTERERDLAELQRLEREERESRERVDEAQRTIQEAMDTLKEATPKRGKALLDLLIKPLVKTAVKTAEVMEHAIKRDGKKMASIMAVGAGLMGVGYVAKDPIKNWLADKNKQKIEEPARPRTPTPMAPKSEAQRIIEEKTIIAQEAEEKRKRSRKEKGAPLETVKVKPPVLTADLIYQEKMVSIRDEFKKVREEKTLQRILDTQAVQFLGNVLNKGTKIKQLAGELKKLSELNPSQNETVDQYVRRTLNYLEEEGKLNQLK